MAGREKSDPPAPGGSTETTGLGPHPPGEDDTGVPALETLASLFPDAPIFGGLTSLTDPGGLGLPPRPLLPLGWNWPLVLDDRYLALFKRHELNLHDPAEVAMMVTRLAADQLEFQERGKAGRPRDWDYERYFVLWTLVKVELAEQCDRGNKPNVSDACRKIAHKLMKPDKGEYDWRDLRNKYYSLKKLERSDSIGQKVMQYILDKYYKFPLKRTDMSAESAQAMADRFTHLLVRTYRMHRASRRRRAP